MMLDVVCQVAPLAQRTKVPQVVVARIVVQVGRGQHDEGGAKPGGLHDVGPGGRLPATVAPVARLDIVPSAVRQAFHADLVRTPACLAPAGSALETDAAADLGPVGWVGGAEVRSDRHR